MVEELEKAENQIGAVMDGYKKSVQEIAKAESDKKTQSEIESIRKTLQ